MLSARIASTAAVAVVLASVPSSAAALAPQRAALRYWHRAPAGCGLVAVTYAPAPPSDAPGLVTYGWTDRVGAPCHVFLNPGLRARVYRRLRCFVVVHEWGHLLGYGHSPDPASVMYPIASHHPRATPRVCSNYY